jgi:hypothetical protein
MKHVETYYVIFGPQVAFAIARGGMPDMRRKSSTSHPYEARQHDYID